jgi:uncharacterized protein (TIGR02118 family)
MLMDGTRRGFLKAAAAFASAAPIGMPGLAEAQPTSEAIKIIHFFARKKGLTPKQFVDYWLHVHGPMTLKVPGSFSGYVLADVVGVSDNAPPDAIMGLSESFSPNPAARAQTLSSPEGKALVADQDVFIGKSRSFATKEHVFVDHAPKNGAIKQVRIVVRKAGISHDAFVRQWLDIYGPLARGIPGQQGFILSEFTEVAKDAELLPLSGELDGLEEAWWAGGKPQPSPALDRLNAEADNFIDRAKSITLTMRDNILITPHYG